jgi:hypothetical protein
VHVVRDVVIDKRLNFADKAAMNSHFVGRHETGLLHDAAMMGDGREVLIQLGETLVGLQFALKMVDSHLCRSFA